MSSCTIHENGSIDLYFYGELDQVERLRVEQHLRGCRDCSDALGELKIIRDALASRPNVAAPASGDWSAFMQRLDANLEPHRAGNVIAFLRPPAQVRRSVAGWLAVAALLAVVSAGVFVASQAGRDAVLSNPANPLGPANRIASGSIDDLAPVRAGLASVGIRHLEKSKLVVLGLANKGGSGALEDDWAYERELATALLNDTRLYRLAAEQRGLASLAGLMKDLELVLLQASMARESDATALPQIQRLIRKRGLVEKMDVVGTTGLVP